VKRRSNSHRGSGPETEIERGSDATMRCAERLHDASLALRWFIQIGSSEW